jgi:hypothetical protein
MPLNFLETAHYKLRCLTGKNPGHEIGTGFADLGEDVDKVLFEKVGLTSASKYSAPKSITEGKEEEPNATRATFVVLVTGGTTPSKDGIKVLVGGVVVAELLNKGINTEVAVSCSFIVPPAVKWKWTGLGGVEVSYLPL